MFNAGRGDSKNDVGEANRVPIEYANYSVIERKAEAALPDLSQDAKAVAALTAILHPPASEIDINQDFCCPITRVLIREPVQTVDGQLYEREAIEEWLKKKDTSPITGAVLANKTLAPNIFAQKQIASLLEKYPVLKDSAEWYLPRSWIERLMTALRQGDEKTIRELVEKDHRLLVHPLNADTGQRSIHLAAAGDSRSLALVITLLEKRQKGLGLQALLEADEAGYFPIHRAMLAKQPVKVLLLLCDWMGNRLKEITLPNAWLQNLLGRYYNNSALDNVNDVLRLSVIEQNLMYIDFLLQHGANPNACNKEKESLLYLAVKHGKIHSLSALLVAKANPNQDINRGLFDIPLHTAIRQGDLEAVVVLRGYGARLTDHLRDGGTPLHLAAEQNNPKIADVLYENESLTAQQLEAKDKEGHTPLHRALIKAQIDMAQWLIGRKADVNAQNTAGHSALHIAARFNRIDGLLLLLKHGATLTAKDQVGNTALHLAADAGAIDALEALLRQGLSAESLNTKGQTARQLAEANHHPGLIVRYDKVVNELRAKEENELKAHGVLGVMLLRMQHTIQDQQAQILRQQHIVEDQQAQLLRQQHTIEDQQAQLLKLQASFKLQNRDIDGLASGLNFFTEKQKAEEARKVEAARKEEAKKVLEIKAPAFLKLVALGEQDRAEAFLKATPALALCYSAVTDISNHHFKCVTAFQYAVWALDWHMWTMLLKYLPKEQAAQQFLELEEEGTEHGSVFNLQPLLDALSTYTKLSLYVGRDKRTKQWGEVIVQQSLLPAHVLQEYCRSDRSFDPCPTFKEASLPRGFPENFLFEYFNKAGILRCGSNCVVVAKEPLAPLTPLGIPVYGGYVSAYGKMPIEVDVTSLFALAKCRTEQREMLASTFQPGQALHNDRGDRKKL